MVFQSFGIYTIDGYKKKGLKIPMGKLEAVNRRIFNTMFKKSTKYVA
jgi:hypothetical protein